MFISLCYERVSVSFLKLILIKSQVMYYLLLFSRRTIVAIMYRGVARAARMCTQNARGGGGSGGMLPRTFLNAITFVVQSGSIFTIYRVNKKC